MMEHTDENKHVLKLSEEKQHEHLLDEIKEVSRLLACNRQWFELESNQDMIEACIYEDRALQALSLIHILYIKLMHISNKPLNTIRMKVKLLLLMWKIA